MKHKMHFNNNKKCFLIIFCFSVLIVICGFLSTIFMKAQVMKHNFIFTKSNITISFSKKNEDFNQYDGYYYELFNGEKSIQKVYLGNDFDDLKIRKKSNGFTIMSNENMINFIVEIDINGFLLFHINRTLKKHSKAMDCFYLDSNHHWYGGPEQKFQYWPIEKLTLNKYAYVSKDGASVSERYWLTTNGLFIYINNKTPLFVYQNTKYRSHLCFKAKMDYPYYSDNDKEFTFNYTIGIANDVREAHLKAIRYILKKPIGIPDERMIKYPMWSTKINYGRKINETNIKTYTDEIIKSNFKYSYLEIDDGWENCYGTMKFNNEKFPNIKMLVKNLKKKSFGILLWIHPFINDECKSVYTNAIEHDLFVKNRNGSVNVIWWNSKNNQVTSYLDFTKNITRKYFQKKLNKLKRDIGIDNFKFDAGETSWTPKDPILNEQNNYLNPTQLTNEYLQTTLNNYGLISNVRVGQNTQYLPNFLRMIDKESKWGWNNGLATLIPNLLQLNMVGYSFIMPDIIGGGHTKSNENNTIIMDEELYIRWLQATVFMSVIKFSIPPWNFKNETLNICKKYVRLHQEYSNVIIERFKLAVKTGEPVNPPIWWIDPNNKIAQRIYDQFLLGETIMVAPVLKKNQRSRDIYLPKGEWRDNKGNKYIGRNWLKNYNAPLNVLPYFIRI